MTTPTTIRLPDKLLEQIDRRARARKKDRASMIRELLYEGLARDLEDEVFTAYREGRLSLSQAARKLGLDPWAWLDLLRRRNETLNVTLEDWIDSRSAL